MEEILMYLGIFIISLIVLLKASDYFIESAEKIGLSLGISPFIIGVTIVAFGTSLPELATSIASVLANDSAIVVSNVVGSNITNIALVLGLVAVIGRKIELEYNVWHIDMPFLWGSAFLLWLVLQDGVFAFHESLLFLAGIILFLAYSFKADKADESERPSVAPITYLVLIGGGIGVWLGAEYTIVAVKELSLKAGISSELIAQTVIAFGTSLPEIVVSIAAVRKGQAGIAIGNVLGSNIFNTYIVMAIPSFFGSLVIPSIIMKTSIPIMIMLTILFGIITNNRKITRWEGFLLLMFYAYFLMDNINRVI